MNKIVVVRLKWGIEYKGKLVNFDKYMNFRLVDSEEIIDGASTGKLGEILIRCNNVLFVQEVVE